MTHPAEIKAKCPFWIGSREGKWYCEGYVPKQKINMVFDNKMSKEHWLDEICCDSWEACPWAKTLQAKFGEGNDAQRMY